MKLKDMTDQDLFNMVRETIFTDDGGTKPIPPHISKEIKRRKRSNPDAFDFLKPPPEAKFSVRLSLTNRELNIILGDLFSTIDMQKKWLQDHPEAETSPMIQNRMNERERIYAKLSAKLSAKMAAKQNAA